MKKIKMIKMERDYDIDNEVDTDSMFALMFNKLNNGTGHIIFKQPANPKKKIKVDKVFNTYSYTEYTEDGNIANHGTYSEKGIRLMVERFIFGQ